MGRKHSFISSEFRGDDYDSSDDGEFVPDLVGVAMPFTGPECDAAYETIKGACKTLGLRPERVDEYSRSGVVLRDIAELIENAEFLIFDLSYERQNVYYELGYAHGVGNEASDILLIAREGTKLHYDISGLRVHFYHSLDELHRIVAENLKKMMEAARE